MIWNVNVPSKPDEGRQINNRLNGDLRSNKKNKKKKFYFLMVLSKFYFLFLKIFLKLVLFLVKVR